MIICRTAAELRAARRALVAPVGFVPTMGALHAGHESLAARAAHECASVVASVFVNPLQFGPNDDYEKYPRSLESDGAILERYRVAVLFAPEAAAMYPPGSQTMVDPGAIARHLEGEFRPGHFRGVATVVLKLFNIVAPDRAYFGSKDAQQLAVVRRMASDFDLQIAIVDCPTVRESDGLAISSRNRFLSDAQRRDAVLLSRALRFVVETIQRGGVDLGVVLQDARAQLGPLRADYLAVVDPNEFVPLEKLPEHSDLLAVGAAHCGSTRLIDNMAVHTT